MEGVPQDIRYSFRMLRKSPGFTAVAVLTLALGIGAHTAIFSVVNAVLLQPLAYKESDSLVVILHSGRNPVAPASFLEWQRQSRSFETMGAAEFWTPNVTRTENAEKLWGLHITSTVLPMLGVQPILGRFFLPEEEQRGKEHEVVISFPLWQSHFAANPEVIGKPITLDGQVFTIVGVMPRGFKFAPFWATKSELWAPLVLGDRANDLNGGSLRVFARLKPDVTLAQARAEMAGITARLEQQNPGTNEDVRVLSLKEKVVGNVRPALLVLLAAVGFVLLIACANVAHMLLARSAARQKEIAIRAAVGADNFRLVRQFLTESCLLALLGGIAGFLLAFGGIRLLVALSPSDIPRLDAVALDARVLMFALILTLFAGFIFGLAPALRATGLNLSDSLKEGERGSSEGIRRNPLRSLLLASELAFALVLLVGAGLMIRSFVAIQSIDPGFNPHHLLSAVVSVTGTRAAEPGARPIFYKQLLEQIRRIPGVQSASAINHLPLAVDVWGLPFQIEGQPMPRPSDRPTATFRAVFPGYFKTMNVPILRGRDVTDSDSLDAQKVVLINEWLASHHWPGQNAIGKHIAMGSSQDHLQWLTVVGVVKNTLRGQWTESPEDELFVPYLQNRAYMTGSGGAFSYATLVVATAGDPASMAPAIRGIVRGMDESAPLSEVQTMDQVVSEATAEPRFYVVLMGAFGAVALLLAAIGIYGVMSYSVSRRTQEIGIRIALGARAGDVIKLVVGQAAFLALAGVSVGVVAAFALTGLMARMLYGIRPSDPITFVVVVVVLSTAALVASYIPARHATQVDPMAALRYE